MRQIEATPQRPFYSVSYEYAQNPWTNYSFNRFFEVTGDPKKRTMPGTESEALAVQCADYLVTQPSVKFAYVSKTTDCYNHQEVYKATRS